MKQAEFTMKEAQQLVQELEKLAEAEQEINAPESLLPITADETRVKG